jgi:hypothetical protein
LHNNYTPIGRKQPDFEGGITPNHTLNGVPEWAYGVTDWLELGLYSSNAPSSTVSGTTPSHQIPIAQIARLSRDGPLVPAID